MDEGIIIEGTITLADGSTSQFIIDAYGSRQWGANDERLSKTVPILEGFLESLKEQ